MMIDDDGMMMIHSHITTPSIVVRSIFVLLSQSRLSSTNKQNTTLKMTCYATVECQSYCHVYDKP